MPVFLVGLSGVAVDMAVYFLLSSVLAWHVNVLVTISALVAMSSNYLLNRNLTWAIVSSRRYAYEP